MTETITQLDEFNAGKPGIYENIPASVYHALPAVSSSVLKRITTHSPAHALDLMRHGMEATDEMDIGSAAHCLLFTPSEFDSQFTEAPKCGAIKKDGAPCGNSAIGADADGCWLCGVHAKGRGASMPDGVTILAPDAMDRARGIVAAVQACPVAMDILDSAGDFELSVIAIDAETGLTLKARLDIYCRELAILPDLKTCRSSHPDRFRYQARDLAYDVQLCFYKKVANMAGLDVATTPIIAGENTSPFVVTVFDPSDGFVANGEMRMDKALKTYAECVERDVWPGYAQGIQLLDVV